MILSGVLGLGPAYPCREHVTRPFTAITMKKETKYLISTCCEEAYSIPVYLPYDMELFWL